MAQLTVQYCSDLHLEFPKNKAYYQANPIVPTGDILVLAGDIIPFQMMEYFDWFFDQLESQFKAVYWIAGNHEYYGFDISQRSGAFEIKIRENIYLINNYKLNLGDIQILFTSLWSEIKPQNYRHVQRGMSDYYHIKNGNNTFNPNDSTALFRDNMNFLKTEMANNSEVNSRIIVSHHVPTYKNYPTMYKNSLLNDAFATELAPFIMDNSINYWIYGHSHCNVPNFKVGDTVLTNNQLGYVGHNEHLDFQKDAIITL